MGGEPNCRRQFGGGHNGKENNPSYLNMLPLQAHGDGCIERAGRRDRAMSQRNRTEGRPWRTRLDWLYVPAVFYLKQRLQ